MHGDQALLDSNNATDEPLQRKISVKKKQMPADETREIEVNQRTTSTQNFQNMASESNQSSNHSVNGSISSSISDGRNIYSPPNDSGVALPEETAAETEAVLEAIAEDGKRGDKSDSDNEAEEVSSLF